MFGFSLQKLFVLATIIGAVWFGFKLVSRLQEARKLNEQAGSGRRPKATRRNASPAESAEDMIQCPVCKAYVAARTADSCGRPDCPY